MPKVSSDAPHILDKKMWRRVRAQCHPDRGGDHELFIWLDAIHEALNGRYTPPSASPPKEEQANGSPETPFSKFAEPFEYSIHANVLWRVFKDYDAFFDADRDEATKPQIAKIAHEAGMNRYERYAFYETCEDFGLTKRAASWLIEELINGH